MLTCACLIEILFINHIKTKHLKIFQNKIQRERFENRKKIPTRRATLFECKQTPR